MTSNIKISDMTTSFDKMPKCRIVYCAMMESEGVAKKRLDDWNKAQMMPAYADPKVEPYMDIHMNRVMYRITGQGDEV